MTDVNVGIVPNDGTGDPLRNAFIKLNASVATLGNAAKMQVSRPGDNPTAFGLSAVGNADSIAPAAGTPGVTITADLKYGNILRVENLAATIAPRVAMAVPAARMWRAYWYTVRNRDAYVNASAAVITVGIECLSASFTSIGTMLVAAESRSVAQGLWAVGTTFAQAGMPLASAEYYLPVGTVYVRPFVKFNGADHITDVIQIDVIDITDAAILGSVDAASLAQAVADASTSATSSSDSAEVSRKWAESDAEPGAVGSKSSKTWAGVASDASDLALISKATAQNNAAAAGASASASAANLLALGEALSNVLSAFSVNGDGDLVVSYNSTVITNIEIDANSGDLLITYEV